MGSINLISDYKNNPDNLVTPILGFLIVIVIGLLIYNYFTNIKSKIPAQKVEKTAELQCQCKCIPSQEEVK